MNVLSFIVKHKDNLKMEGSFQGLKSEMHSAHHGIIKGSRVAVAKHADNLKVGGSMQFESTSQGAAKAITKVDYSSNKQQQRRRDAQSSIVVGEDVTSTNEAVKKHVEERNRQVTTTASTVTANRAESAAARSKQITSQGVSSTVVQNEGQEANISAVKTDKFASSLRESSASAHQTIGQQKDMAVIEQHQQRRQSNSAHAALQSSTRQSWRQQQSSNRVH